ncbi:Radical SAM domain protein [Desulfarculus baarsii DSM 2075]|uniref:Radical SAM domain protein n=1 Tax=Desulfarculus baarsii (strain ATCC 33931 / DSM 2075 / LMG 7858 / VKM B-1802 / 2st14) TaxID=644282 RepID=E1QFR4_DESB2|nr:radical SAM protein [Desulfarculus baarsii]ADK84400.1 Radical SAM domain protein [Desulfarculus baarsii DSM 2075]
MYNHVVLDISGKCNARCTWCVTGYRNRQGVAYGRYMTPQDVAKVIDYLREQRIITPDAYFFLYNWGEPLINPHFAEIVEELNRREVTYIISTNASRVVEFAGADDLRNLRAIVFSMCGFSQASYERVHGFNFEKIKNNIQRIMANYRAHGFAGKAEIRYHVYQFNLDEIPGVLAFAKENHLGLSPTYAGIPDLKRLMAYFADDMEPGQLKDVSRDLIFHYVDEVAARMPADYRCPYHDALLIDDDFQVLTCCLVTPEMENYSIGNLFDLDLERMRELKVSQPICAECYRLAAPYLVNNRPYPKLVDELDLRLDSYDPARPLYVWGAKRMGVEAAARLRAMGLEPAGFIEDDDDAPAVAIDPAALHGVGVLEAGGARPFVVVASEYMHPKIQALQRMGYRPRQDYEVTAVVKRDY